MKSLFTVIALFVLASTSFAEGPQCMVTPSELQTYMEMDYHSFDQTLPDGGWRGLANKGCELESTKLLEIYHLHHLGTLEPWQGRVLYWHAGQVYALLDLRKLAITRFKQSFDPHEKSDSTFLWNSYVAGSIAFLEHDMPALLKARDELRKVDKIEPNPNLKFLEAFVRCFDKTYKETYSGDCH